MLQLTCLDLEGVLIPEIWQGVAARTGIDELNLTTRDIADYDELMKKRLSVVNQNNITMKDIQAVISEMDPLPGAIEFTEWLRSETQLIILSDTFQEFAAPLMKKLGMPTIFCHSLEIDANGKITDYKLRQQDQKKKAVAAFKSLNYQVFAAGDSYNDVSMLKEAHAGFFFKPNDKIIHEFPEFPVTHKYADLKKLLKEAFNKI